MKNFVSRSLFVLVVVLAGLVASAPAQTDPIAGGYGPAKVDSTEVKQAAAVAVRDHARKERHYVTLVKIVKAEQQVVSGMNYRMCLRVRRPGHKAHAVTAVVYQPIRKKMRLTDWAEGECTD